MADLEPNILVKKFQIAGRFHIIATRFLDIIIAGLIALPLGLTENKWGGHTLWATGVLIGVTFVILVLYFLVIPWLWKGQTLGKKICQLKLVVKQPPITFKVIILRELFIIFIPWMMQLGSDLIISLILKVSFQELLSNNPNYKAAYLIFRIIAVMVFFWYVYLVVAVCFDPEHQFFLDRKFQVYLVKKHPIKNQRTDYVIPDPINREESHIHLAADQPGNISEEGLKSIEDQKHE